MSDQLPVAIGCMTAGDIRFETAESIYACIVTKTISRTFFVQNGPYLDNGRNNMVRVFNDPAIKDSCTHLLMVDSDISFVPADVLALYEASQDRAVVSGIYHSVYNGMTRPVIYESKVNEKGLNTLEAIEKWDDGWSMWPDHSAREGLDPVVRVEAAGAGFLMIRREVIDVLESVFGEPQPWFTEPVIDGIHYGEDLAFCVRARESGFGVWAHRGVEVVHYKNTPIGLREQARP